MSNNEKDIGYLDDQVSDPIKRSALLQEHLRKQPYYHLVRPGERALGSDEDDEDDVEDDEERKERQKKRRRAAARRKRRRRTGGTERQDDEDETDSFASWDSEEEARLAQEEWEESIGQLNLVLQVMVLPFFGKWLGRKTSYWIFSRYQSLGWTSAFFGLEWLWTPNTIVPGSAVALLQP